MASTNIYNTTTGQLGYQVPGAAAPAGWAYGTPPAPTTPAPGAGIVSGSTSIVNNEKATTATVKSLSSSLPEAPKVVDNSGLTTAHDASMATINDYMSKLEARRQEEIKGINAGFDVAKTNQGVAQEKETGSTSVGIARMGGYLGGSGSGTGVMLNLAQSHRNEVVALEAKRQDAIRQANTAIEDKQFQLARDKVAEAKSFEEQVYKRNQDFWDNQIKYEAANRAQDTFLQDKYKDELTALAAVGGVPDAKKASEIDSFYGVPGFSAKYVAIQKADAEAKSDKARFDSFKAKMDMLESIPAGLKVQFGDETITGLGKTSDISTFHVEDAAGNVTLVTKNLRTGALTTQGLGAIGTPSAGGGGAGGAIAAMSQDLSSLTGPDGYVSPTDYKNGLKLWLSKGNTLSTYESNFKTFANPAHPQDYDFSSYYNKSSDQLMQALLGGQ